MSRLLFNEDFFFAVEKRSEANREPDLVILNKPVLREVSDEIRFRAAKGFGYRIAIITDIYRIRMLDSMFFNVDFILTEDEREIEKEVKDILEKRIDEENTRITYTDLEYVFMQNLAYGLNMQELTHSMKITDRSARRIKEKLLKKTGLFSLQQLSIYALLSDKINIHSC